MTTTPCFHCGDPIPPKLDLTVTVKGEEKPVCCHGCQAVAEMIVDAGLGNFYDFREGRGAKADEYDKADHEDKYLAYDRDAVQQTFVRSLDSGEKEADILLENLYCAACGWLIEHTLSRQEGVTLVHVNTTSGRAVLRWDPTRIHLSELMRGLAKIGYPGHPHTSSRAAELSEKERRAALKRLIIAGLGMMQVMTFAIGLYAGAFQGMAEEHRVFLRWVSLLVATPVLLYSALPFFRAAYRDLRHRRLGMDVPVALAMAGAYLASVYATLSHGPEVYFDSVVMFVFFLSLGRYLEMTARHRTRAVGDTLKQLLPTAAIRVTLGGDETVGVMELQAGDHVRVKAGDIIPADGVILDGHTRVDESMLTGESTPLARAQGSTVMAGSQNLENPIVIEARQIGHDTTVSAIGRMLERAQMERPRVAQLADRIAAWVVGAILILAGGAFLIWHQIDPAQAFPVALAVLVATCPCALSLATPTALVAATGHLVRHGLLVTRADALETLARTQHLVFDKTGTLTQGKLNIDRIEPLAEGLSNEHCLDIAAALELGSEHPLGRAFRHHPSLLRAENVRILRGAGIEGEILGRRYRIGSPAFIHDWLALDKEPQPPEHAGMWVLLADQEHPLCWFRLADQARPDLRQHLAALRAEGFTLEIASGDSEPAVAAVADHLGIIHYHARMLPADKLQRIKALQREGITVAMVGDGINDAPVLAGADVSIAMGEGTALAQQSAAMVLMEESLAPLLKGVQMARASMRVIRQNLTWAIGYNLTAVPLAALGFLPPWAAAIGMSASSLIVVLNASRLAKHKEANP